MPSFAGAGAADKWYMVSRMNPVDAAQFDANSICGQRFTEATSGSAIDLGIKGAASTTKYSWMNTAGAKAVSSVSIVAGTPVVLEAWGTAAGTFLSVNEETPVAAAGGTEQWPLYGWSLALACYSAQSVTAKAPSAYFDFLGFGGSRT